MSKTLSNILTVFKVAKIVAKVIYILCLVGAGGCLLGLCTLPLLGTSSLTEMVVGEKPDLASSYLTCSAGLVTCAGEFVFAFLAERYFGSVLAANTPFTLDGSKECFRFGIASIIVSLASSVITGAIHGIFLIFFPELAQLDVGTSLSLSAGLFFLFLSLIFKHGAELQAPENGAPAQEE